MSNFMTNNILTELMIYFLFSSVICFMVIKFIHPKFIKFTSTPCGPQKIHHENIPRLGGLSLFLTLILIAFVFEKGDIFLKYLIISIPIFFLGLLEDITQAVSPRIRLIASLFSSLVFILIFDVTIKKTGIEFIDRILINYYVSVIFSIMCITFLIQAFNIIDGLNGLCLNSSILSFVSISAIAFYIENLNFFLLSVSMTFILLGILIFNFPYGKIFLGDSGAYLIGLILAMTLINFANQNENISPFVIISLIIYPSYELTRSMLRRYFFDKTNISHSDFKHLHSVLYLYNLKKYKKDTYCNTLSSFQILVFQFVNSLYLIIYYENVKFIIFGIIIFILIYELLYFYINKKLQILDRNMNKV